MIHCISAAPAALDRYPRGVTSHVAHPIRSIPRFRLQISDFRFPLSAFSSFQHLNVSTSQLLSLGIVKEIVLSSAARVFTCSAVSSNSGGRTFAHA